MGTSADTQKCPSCGAEVPVNALLCPKCGRANVSTAFASPSSGAKSSAEGSSASFLYSTTDSPVAPAQTVENTTLQVKSTEIPKTLLPWETAYTPLDTPQPPADSGAMGTAGASAAQPGPAPASAGDRQANLEEIADLRKAQMQRPELSIDELRQARRVGGQAPRPGYGPPPQQMPPQGGPVNAQQGWYGAYQPGPGQTPPDWRPSGPYQNNPYRYNTGPLDAQRQNAAPTYNTSSTAAFMLEFLGYVGFLGVGHIYAGRYRRGFALMLAWWLIAATVCGALFAFSSQPEAGLLVLIAAALPLLSGFWIRYDVDSNGPRPSSSQVRRNK